MIIRAVDGTNDWQFGKGRNDYKGRGAALSQNIQQRLQSFLGDCFFAINDGIDWFNLLGSKNQVALELAVRTTILNTVGVTGIVSLEIEYVSATRQINMTYVVNSIYTANLDVGPIFGKSSLILTQDGEIITTQDGDPITTG